MVRPEEDAYLLGAVEALLFVSDEPVSAARLASFLEVPPSRVDKLLCALQEEYRDDERGMQLREVAGGWRLYSHPAYHDLIEKYIISWDTRRLSQAALEVLAIIAYHQPVTRAGVNAVRGVSSDGVISSLVEKGLVRELGRDKGPGAAILYGTTNTFLERFGLKSIKDLPPLEDFAVDEESKQFIRERLSGTRIQSEGEQISLEEAEAEADESLQEVSLNLVDENGLPQAEEVDRGDDERRDDAEAMAAILGEAITEKAEL